MNKDIVDLVRNCVDCEKYQRKNVKEPVILREIPELLFEMLVADICKFGGASYLIVMDYLIKWIEIVPNAVPLQSKTSQSIISSFKTMFATHGTHLEVGSDNIMPFGSKESREFSKEWNFKFVTSSPRYSRANDQAERAVQIVKNIFRKCEDLQLALLEYRNTPLL
ncbi:uncharacterized protein [Diabrotica undecimpunctata]|uniref:uncharacterized protein n=1 Tax=Diabrotica undecimpunctata TaxID=50387 RepID=UPI003B63E440